MAMSAASASSIVVSTIASATVATTSASSTGEHVYHAFDFVIGGGTAFYHFTDKGEVFASQTVVQVNDDFCLLYFYQLCRGAQYGVSAAPIVVTLRKLLLYSGKKPKCQVF